MAKVLVTGASGFTGSALANQLAKSGHHVRALVRTNSNTSLLDETLLEQGNVELFYADLRDSIAVDRATQGVEFVYHVAALYRAAKHPDKTYWDVNVEGTRHVLSAAKKHGVLRTLHCSTIGVHGGVTKIPGHEQSPFSAGDIYQTTKLEGEMLARNAAEQGQPVCIVRPAGIYGPGDLRFLKLFSMVQSGRFIMFGSGQTFMHMVFIDDLVRGMILAMENESSLRETIILAGEEYVTLNELVRLVAVATETTSRTWRLPIWPLMTAATLCEWVCKPLGVEPPLHRRRAAFFTKDRAFSIDHARNLIGYQPQVDLADGLKRTAEWYAQNNLL